MTTKTDEQEREAFMDWLTTHCDYDDLNKSEVALALDAWQAAIELDRQQLGEPVALVHRISGIPMEVRFLESANYGMSLPDGAELYLAPQPADPAACASCAGSGEDQQGYQQPGPDGDCIDGPCRECGGTGSTPVAAQPSVPDGWPKWYCVDKNGNADLCRSESEAYDYARLRRDAFPDRAPFQAMPLTPAPPAAEQAQQATAAVAFVHELAMGAYKPEEIEARSKQIARMAPLEAQQGDQP
jgi:hypothetical protein